MSLIRAIRRPYADGAAAAAGFSTDYASEMEKEVIQPYYSESGAIRGLPKTPSSYKAYSRLGVISKLTAGAYLAVDNISVAKDDHLTTGQKYLKGSIIVIGAASSYLIGGEIVAGATAFGGPVGFVSGLAASAVVGTFISYVQSEAINKFVGE